MLLDDLVGVIETLKERIAAHGVSLRENETRTRMALIDPLLQALGWDTSDPAMVTPEYSVGASRADYALLTSNGNPSALVEAKKLDESLASHRMQMLNYTNISGIPHAGLTDGNHWEMYTVFDQAPIEQRRILDVSIASTPAHEAALKLLLLWRPNLALEKPVVPILEPVPEPDGPTWIPLTDIKYSKESTNPIAVRFVETKPKPIDRWQDLWFETWEWLAISGRLCDESYFLPDSRTRHLANRIGKHPPNPKTGKIIDFRTRRRTSTGMFVECNDDAPTLIKNTIYILEKFDYSPSDVLVQFP